MTRLALGLEYDGRAFHGWQQQKGLLSVQAVLEAALAQIAGAPVRTHCAGRTDAGVHAVQQVVHFEVEAARPLTAWVRGINSLLPASVAVRWVVAVPDAFDARFSAFRRRYRYILLNRPERPGLWAGRAGWLHRPLALAPMQTAAAFLLGEHDFSAFRAAGCQAKTPVKLLTRAEVRQAGELFFFDFEANAFLHHMVRNLVGSLVYVGKGAWAPERLQAVLAGRERSQAAPTFVADGLYFLGPRYPAHFGLPEVPDFSFF
jgi:tRNA pseudouridine38-40 synthase